MRVIMSGGGTGGHIYPAIAIADKIKDRRPDAEILFVGTERGLEKALVPQSGHQIRFITASGFNRKKMLKNFKTLSDLGRGLSEAKAIIKEFKPDVVIGTGGYVCGPVAKAAHSLGVRVFIHEQNAFPGLTNRLLEKHAEKIFLGFEEAGAHFKKKDKLVFSGNPVREDFFKTDKESARAKLGVGNDSFIVLSFGGSQGAAKLNEVMAEVAAVLSGIENVTLFFATGRFYYDSVVYRLQEDGTDLGKNIYVLPYLDEMEQYLAACDVVVSRAGALTVSEITVCGKPAILVPSPNVTGNHQHFNAKALADRGGAVLMEEKDLTAGELIKTLTGMKNDCGQLAKMAAASRGAARSGAADVICENIGLLSVQRLEEQE